jgi:TupA-like ATPgrasp
MCFKLSMRFPIVIKVIDSLVLKLANVILSILNINAVLQYRRFNGRFPNIANPRRYAERMLWRKVVDHNPQFVVFSDKLATKEYCNRICPDLALPKTLWVGNDADAIPDELLSGDVFVKTNHGWNYNYQIRAGEVDRADLKRKTDQWLNSTHGKASHQWAYSKVEPILYVEETIGDAAADLLEFNIRASNGNFVLGSVMGHNKKPNKWLKYLDLKGESVEGIEDEGAVPVLFISQEVNVIAPYLQAIAYAKQLSVGVDYARFDFMWNGKNLYGGEITVYPGAGNGRALNSKLECIVIKGWDLVPSYFLTSKQTGIKKLYANALKSQMKHGI